MATGGVYNQDVKYGNQKSWKVSKPYGLDDGAFETTVTSVLKYISSKTGIDAVADRVEYSLKDVTTDRTIELFEEFKQKRQLERTSLLVDSVDYLKD